MGRATSESSAKQAAKAALLDVGLDVGVLVDILGRDLVRRLDVGYLLRVGFALLGVRVRPCDSRRVGRGVDVKPGVVLVVPLADPGC